MDGLPVTIRLLDPPLHEFLPDLTELSVRVAVAEANGRADEADLRLLQAVRGCTSRTRCSACAACGSAWSIPGLFALQVRAIAEAAASASGWAATRAPEIMIPLVGTVQELELIRDEAQRGRSRRWPRSTAAR